MQQKYISLVFFAVLLSVPALGQPVLYSSIRADRQRLEQYSMK